MPPKKNWGNANSRGRLGDNATQGGGAAPNSPTTGLQGTAAGNAADGFNGQTRLQRAMKTAGRRGIINPPSVLKFILFAFVVYFLYTRFGVVYAAVAVAAALARAVYNVARNTVRWVVNTADGAAYTEALRRADIMREPVTAKDIEDGENDQLSYGYCSMQGWRRSMEDAHTMRLFPGGGMFAVFDGHSGSATANFCGENLYNFIVNTKAYAENDLSSALYDGFIAIDRHLYALPNFERSGCTAVVLFIRNEMLYCANAGDSRCVLCRDGAAYPLSVDHKPFLNSEQTRIERAGGYVWNRRVNGILALSRAIGDFGFKGNSQVTWEQQAVTSAPEVRTTPLDRDRDEFAVVACDGIWDVLNSDQVVEFVRSKIQQRLPLSHIAGLLMEKCLSPVPFGFGCDNMSVIIVQFKRGGGAAAGAITGVGAATASLSSGSPSLMPPLRPVTQDTHTISVHTDSEGGETSAAVAMDSVGVHAAAGATRSRGPNTDASSPDAGSTTGSEHTRHRSHNTSRVHPTPTSTPGKSESDEAASADTPQTSTSTENDNDDSADWNSV